MNTKDQLHHLHRVIFEETNVGLLYPVLHQLHDIYSKASGITAGDMTDSSIDLPSGKAISPIGAAHCLLEIARTSKFVRGVHQAVLQLKKDFHNVPIRILYAGSGPYATLVTPLTSVFSSEEIIFDIMDINENSLQAVQKMYHELGLLSYVNNFIHADATQYQLPNDKQPHMIVAETMNAALKNEPQIALMLNLVPQMREKTIFIPQEITVKAFLLDIGKETQGFRVGAEQAKRLSVGHIYTLSKVSCHKPLPIKVKIPNNRERNNLLSLLTEITVFGDEKLGIYDCSLTLPQKVCRLDDGLKNVEVQFEYNHGPKPRFEHQLITAD